MSLTRLKGIFETDKGASLSNEYEIDFRFDTTKNATLINNFTTAGFTVNSSVGAYSDMMMLCDEASLPGQYAATQEIDGLYTGRLIQYPHGKLYNDFSLSFIMTNKEHPNKFFEIWLATIFPEKGLNTGTAIDPSNLTARSERTNITTLTYYDNIVCSKIDVKKSHKSKTSPSGVTTSIHSMYKAYPYSIESVPLAYGPSVLNKLRVQFRYEKHVINHNPS